MRKNEKLAGLVDLEIYESYECSKEENAKYSKMSQDDENFPKTVFQRKECGMIYGKIKDELFSEEEIQTLLLIKQTMFIKKIKTYTAIVAMPIIIGVVAYIISALFGGF